MTSSEIRDEVNGWIVIVLSVIAILEYILKIPVVNNLLRYLTSRFLNAYTKIYYKESENKLRIEVLTVPNSGVSSIEGKVVIINSNGEEIKIIYLREKQLDKDFCEWVIPLEETLKDWKNSTITINWQFKKYGYIHRKEYSKRKIYEEFRTFKEEDTIEEIASSSNNIMEELRDVISPATDIYTLEEKTKKISLIQSNYINIGNQIHKSLNKVKIPKMELPEEFKKSYEALNNQIEETKKIIDRSIPDIFKNNSFSE